MPPDSPAQTLKNLKQHPEYYQPGGDLTVIVGDTCFRVASVFFTRESTIFRDRLLEGVPKGGDEKSPQSRKNTDTSDVCVKQTIVIEAHENVTADDFAQLCSIFFNPKFSFYEKQLNEWEVVLRLAHQWQFGEVSELAFREIHHPGRFSITLVDRIVLYQKYGSPRAYIEPPYEELLLRPTSLSETEGNALGLKSTILIHAAREKLIRTFGTKLEAQPLPMNVKDAVLQAVRELLGGPPLTSLPPAVGRPSSGINTDVKKKGAN